MEFSASSKGRWRSRGLGFKGPFQAKVVRGEAAYLILEDSSTVLRGRMEEANPNIQGSVTHENVADGTFVLQALPDCYGVAVKNLKLSYHNGCTYIYIYR